MSDNQCNSDILSSIVSSEIVSDTFVVFVQFGYMYMLITYG